MFPVKQVMGRIVAWMRTVTHINARQQYWRRTDPSGASRAGRRGAPEGAAVTRTSSHAASVGPAALNWERDVPILTNWLVLSGVIKVFALAGGLLCGLLAFMFAIQGEARLIGPMASFIALIDGGLLVVGTLVAALIYGNRLRYRFSVDEAAALCERIDQRATTIGRLTILLGVLLGKPGAVGTGLISETTTLTSAAWPSIVRIAEHPGSLAIALHNSWRTVLILFCTPENYQAVLDRVKAARQARAPRQRVNPLPGLLLRTVLVVLACIPLFKLPVRIDQFMPFFVLCFALASVWMIPVLAWAVIGGLLVIVGMTALAAMEPYTSYITHEAMRRYDIFSGDDWATFAIALLGTAYLVWLSVGLLRGRVQSGLTGDLIEMEDGS
jgi:hypothetical protein